jgi:hypothetical protein
MSRHVIAALALSASALLALPASAEDVAEKVQLHGFGSWAFGDTDGNRYLAGEEGREYRNTTLGLSVDANAGERLRVVGQAFGTESDEGSKAEFDYAFAEWKFSDTFRLRAGQVKLPFGIYTEVARVGTLRPFLDLPQAVYGPIGLTGEHYRGIGVTGRKALGSNWALAYDAYGGGMVLKELLPPEAYLLGEAIDNSTEIEETKDLLGGRAVLETPVEGLRFGASAYTGVEVAETTRRRTVYGFSGEYVEGPWSLRSEFAHETVKNDLKVDGFYLEAAYRLGAHWQVAAQYDHLTTAIFEAPNPPQPSLLDHEEVALGLNYWFSPGFVLKLDYHRVDGNRFANPDLADFVETIESGQLKHKTNLVQFGAQFSF